MFVLLYVPAVGIHKGPTMPVLCSFRYVPSEWNTRYSSGYMASCVAPAYLFFVWVWLLVVL